MGVSRERIEAIRHALERGNDGDLSALRDLCADDVTAEAGRLWPVGGVAHGPDEVVHIFDSMLAAFERVSSVPEDFVEVGDTLVVPLLWRGVPLGGATEVEQRVVGAFSFRDRELIRLAYFSNLEGALADAARQAAPRAPDETQPQATRAPPPR